jgi:hypothetical protein
LKERLKERRKERLKERRKERLKERRKQRKREKEKIATLTVNTPQLMIVSKALRN